MEKEDKLLSKEEAANILGIDLRTLTRQMAKGVVPFIKTDFLTSDGRGTVYFSLLRLFEKDWNSYEERIQEAQERKLAAEILEAEAVYLASWVKAAKDEEDIDSQIELKKKAEAVKQAKKKLLDFRRVRLREFFGDSAENFFPELYGMKKQKPVILNSSYTKYPSMEEQLRSAAAERKMAYREREKMKKAVKFESSTVWYDEKEKERRERKK